jgi:glycosyltransferase involved in cell wall biosynthesis
MAFGLPIVTTRWRSLPEMLPPNHLGLVAGQDTREISERILTMLAEESGEETRRHFTENFTLKRHLEALSAAIRSVE